MTNEEIKKELREKMPVFMDAVESVENRQCDAVMTTIHSFDEDPLLLHKALKYALSINVPVIFATERESGLMTTVRRRAD